MEMNEWGLPAEKPMNIEEMDKLIQKLSEARQSYEKAKKISSEYYAKLGEVEKEVMNALKANGRTKFEAEGTALVYIVAKETYTTPKTPEQKTALFQYIKDKHGEEALLGLQSINSQTLNAWAAREVEGNPGLNIPGLEAPVMNENLFYRKK